MFLSKFVIKTNFYHKFLDKISFTKYEYKIIRPTRKKNEKKISIYVAS